MQNFLDDASGILLKKSPDDFAYYKASAFFKPPLLKGKVAVVTGCNRGIGRAILEVFAKNGATLFAHARRQTPEFVAMLEALSAKTCATIIPIYFDLLKLDEIKKGVQTIRKATPAVDILVNNAGITLNKLFLMTTADEITTQMDVNFKAVFYFSQYIAKLMQKKGGSIINISSISAAGGDCGRALYGASKAAVESLSKTMAEELGAYNIRVNAIAPGFIATDMMSVISEEAIVRNLNLSKLKRLGKPEEVANAALFLAADGASYITSEVIHVDGGLQG